MGQDTFLPHRAPLSLSSLLVCVRCSQGSDPPLEAGIIPCTCLQISVERDGVLFSFSLSPPPPQDGVRSSSFLIRVLCWAWYNVNQRLVSFRPPQSFPIGRGLEMVRLISRWVNFQMSGNRGIQWKCYFHVIIHSVSHLIPLLSTYYMAVSVLGSEDIAGNK